MRVRNSFRWTTDVKCAEWHRLKVCAKHDPDDLDRVHTHIFTSRLLPMKMMNKNEKQFWSLRLRSQQFLLLLWWGPLVKAETGIPRCLNWVTFKQVWFRFIRTLRVHCEPMQHEPLLPHGISELYSLIPRALLPEWNNFCPTTRALNQSTDPPPGHFQCALSLPDYRSSRKQSFGATRMNSHFVDYFSSPTKEEKTTNAPLNIQQKNTKQKNEGNSEVLTRYRLSLHFCKSKGKQDVHGWTKLTCGSIFQNTMKDPRSRTFLRFSRNVGCFLPFSKFVDALLWCQRGGAFSCNKHITVIFTKDMNTTKLVFLCGHDGRLFHLQLVVTPITTCSITWGEESESEPPVDKFQIRTQFWWIQDPVLALNSLWWQTKYQRFLAKFWQLNLPVCAKFGWFLVSITHDKKYNA